MNRLTRFVVFLLLMSRVYSDDMAQFKAQVLGEIETLKENVRTLQEDKLQKDQEIASLTTKLQLNTLGRQEDSGKMQKMAAEIRKVNDEFDYLVHFTTLLNVPQTCQELGSLGVNRSGTFPIDPDGKNSNEKPITVQCDFPSGKTILGDTTEIAVGNCATDLCFDYKIETINMPQSQITALMEASLTCVQEVTYSCLSAPWKVPTYIRTGK